MTPSNKLDMLKGLDQHLQRSKEWFKQREGRLTSSDAGTALSLNPYQNPFELLKKKCGAGEPFNGNVATLHGQKYEDIAIEHYCNAMGKRNHEFGLIDYDAVERDNDHETLKKYPNGIGWMAGSTDGIAEDINKLEDLVVLEVKCPYRRKIIHGYCPDYYYPQVQLNMAILNIEKADYIEFIPANHFGNKLPIQMNIVRIQRDRKWFDKNVVVLEEMWRDIVYWRLNNIYSHPEYVKPKKTLDLGFVKRDSMFVESDSDSDC